MSARRRVTASKAQALADWSSMSCRLLVYGKPQSSVEGGAVADLSDMLTAYQGVQAFGERVIARHGLWRGASALAFMSQGPHDVRPHLLLLHYGQVGESIEPCVKYGANYLSAWCDRCEIGRTWGSVFEDAAADGLAVLYWGRHTRESGRIPVDQRTVQHRISPRDYVMLRVKAEDIFRQRLREAVERFDMAMGMERFTPENSYSESRKREMPACISDSLASRAA